MSDTPRTDAMEQCGDCVDDLRTAYGNLLSFARELERENTKLRELLTEIYDASAPAPHHTPVKLYPDLRGRIGSVLLNR